MVNTCTFNNFYYAVGEWNASATHTFNVSGCTFNNNHMGVVGTGGIAPSIGADTFNIPKYTGVGPTSYPATEVAVVNDQNVGVAMLYTTGYTVYANIFKTTAAAYDSFTTGTLEYNTGGDNNIVTGNTFTGLGTAMLSNFINRSTGAGTKGLRYQCNTDNHVDYDIAALGNNTIDGGINVNQLTLAGGAGYPAGNNFSGNWNIFNQQQYLEYFYSSPVSSAKPVHNFYYASVDSVPLSSSATCYTPLGIAFSSSRHAGGGTATHSYDGGGTGGTGDDSDNYNFNIAAAYVHYYMLDSSGIFHRDSLYYWAGQMKSPYGDLLIANLLVADSLPDTAYLVYDNIIAKYGLDSSSAEGNDFVQGRNLLDLLVYKKIHNEPLLILNTAQVSTLQSVKTDAAMWAHARAEGWLFAFEGDAITDSLLYPNGPSLVDTGGFGIGRYTNPRITPPGNSLQINQVYPNPVHDVLQVMYTAMSNQNVTIQIEDITGRTVITQSLQTGLLAGIDVSKLVPGMYLYRIFEGSKAKMIGKIAKD